MSLVWPPVNLHLSSCEPPGRVWRQGSTAEKGPEQTAVLGHEPLFLLPSDYSLKDVHDCAKHDFKIGAAIKAVYVKLGVSEATCSNILNEIKGEWPGHVTSLLIILPSPGAQTHQSLS